jgi:hypothetical protein
MKRIPISTAVIALAVGSMIFAGCESNDEPRPVTHSAGFAGGNGEFGESSRAPGDYSDQSRDTHVNPPAKPSAANDR